MHTINLVYESFVNPERDNTCISSIYTAFKGPAIAQSSSLVRIHSTGSQCSWKNGKGNYRPATTTTTPAPSRSQWLPWILKLVELESFGQIIISLNIKPERIIASSFFKEKNCKYLSQEFFFYSLVGTHLA